MAGLASAAIADGRPPAAGRLLRHGHLRDGRVRSVRTWLDGHGRPFNGRPTFMLRAHDGTLPAPGECETGGANFAVIGRKGRELRGVSIGEICGQLVQEPTSVVTQVFAGQYSISESKPRLARHRGLDRDPPRHRSPHVDHSVRLLTCTHDGEMLSVAHDKRRRAELRQRASELLRLVERGETIEITDRGRPVALLAPLPEGTPLEVLRAAGDVEAATGDLDELPAPLPSQGDELPSAVLLRLRRDER